MAGEGSDEKATETSSDEVLEKVRPLTATASRALTKLVENDYEIIVSELRMWHNQQVEDKVREMRAGASRERAEELRQQAVDLLSTYRQERTRLTEEARRDGLTLSIPEAGGRYGGEEGVSITDKDLDTRISRFRNEAERRWSTITNQVKHEELEAKRRVLLASITSDAEKILQEIPSAKDKIKDLSTREITA